MAACRRIALAVGEDVVRTCLSRLLSQSGHVVVNARCPADLEAVDPLPDVVVSDVDFAEGDVIETAAGLVRRGIPVLLLAPSWDDERRARAERAGVFRCLVRPIGRAELEANIALACENTIS